MERTELTHPKYRSDIDGLRAVSVFAVVIYHAFPAVIAGGFIGVDLFFVISGYLISSIIFENLAKGTFSFSEFYMRRIKRIFPALLLVFVFCLVFGWYALLANEYKQLGKHVLSGASFVSNFVLWGEVSYFDNASETKPLLHLWSLAIEEQFYLIWPFMLWLLWRWKLNLLVITFVIAVLSFGLNISGIERSESEIFYSPYTRFWELLCGSLLAWFVLNKATFFATLKKHSASSFVFNVLSFVGIGLIGSGFWVIDKTSVFPGYWALLPVIGAVLIIFAGPNAWFNRTVLSNRVLVWFGLISFPLYLWHWPLLSFARIVEGDVPSFTIRMVVVCLSIGLAWVTFRFIESPIRQGRISQSLRYALIGLMIFVGVAGYSVDHFNGFESRRFMLEMTERNEDLKFNFSNKEGWLCDELIYEGARCYYEGESPSVVIVGDSHVPTIYSGLRGLYSGQNKGIGVFGGGDGCPPLLNVVSKSHSGPEERGCIQKTTASMLRLMEEDSVKEIIFSSRGPIYTTSKGFGNFDGDAFDSWVIRFDGEDQGFRSNEEVFEMALLQTFDAFIKAGKKVTYLYDVPELGFDISSCLSNRPFTISGKVRSPCAVSRAEFDLRNKDFRAMIKRVLIHYPSIRTIDLAEALCDEDWCYGAKDGVPFYIDDDHLNRRGSDYVVNRLKDQFF